MAFPSTPLDIAVEFRIDGAWIDFTRISDRLKCLGIGGQDALTITRGRSTEGDRVLPTTLTLRFLDEDSYLDTTNPASPYYGKLGRKTLMRVTIDGEARCVLRVKSFSPEWVKGAISATDTRNLVVTVQAAGPLLDFNNARTPVKSPAYRALTSPAYDSERVAYLPMEEESGATSITSPYGNVVVSTAGTITFGGVSDSVASARLLTFGSADALIFINVPFFTYSTTQSVVATWRTPSTELTNGAQIYRLYFTGGTIDFIDLIYSTGGATFMRTYSGGSLVDTSSTVGWGADILDRELTFMLAITQDGADIDVRSFLNNSEEAGLELTTTITGRTAGRLFAWTIGQSDISGFGIGHAAVSSSNTPFNDFVFASGSGIVGSRGYVGELAGTRLSRLATEEGLSLTVVGFASNTPAMGRQRPNNLNDLIYECVDLDGGILHETRDDFTLTYRTLNSLWNQDPAATLTYASPDAHLNEPFFPAVDEFAVKTRTIATRSDGGLATYTIPDDDPDHLTTQDPEDWRNGWGLVEDPATLNAADDSTLARVAAWRTHIRAWAGKRFPAVVTLLQRDVFTVDVPGQTVAAGLVSADLGDVLTVDTTDGPAWLPPTGAEGGARLLVQGQTEIAGQFQRQLQFVCTPAEPYEVESVDTSGAVLVQAMDDNDTTAYVATSLGPSFWKDSLNSRAYRVVAGGNAMTVPALGNVVATAAYINAGTASHADNASVTPGAPAGMTLDNREMSIMLAAIRSTSGTVVTPTGWAALPGCDLTHVKVLYRWYRTGEAGSATPTVTVTGGAAGDTVSAVIIGVRNVSPYAGGCTTSVLPLAGKASPTAATQSNSSATNVATPAYRVHRNNCLVLAFGWKQDDWTSRTAITGFTESVDVTTTTGNDQSLMIDYVVQTTATDIAALSSTVTGGASAISKSLVIALRPVIALTGVTRGVNGVSTSIAADQAVNIWSPGVNSL